MKYHSLQHKQRIARRRDVKIAEWQAKLLAGAVLFTVTYCLIALGLTR